MNSFQRYYPVLKQYVTPFDIIQLHELWNSYKRKYHSTKHLNEVLKYIDKNIKYLNSEEEFDVLVLSAFFHDAVYDPTRQDNEEMSIRFFNDCFKGDENIKSKVVEIIECTKYRKKPKEKLAKLFWEADNNRFTQGFSKLLEDEKLLKIEFFHVPTKIYKERRIEFLNSNLGLFNISVDRDINRLIEWINKNYK